MSMQDLSGKWIEVEPLTCPASCMFNTLTCGTWKCFPKSFSGKFEIGEDGMMRAVDFYCAPLLLSTASVRPIRCVGQICVS